MPLHTDNGRRRWAALRRWPWWAQGLLWLFAWPVPLVLLALSKPPATRRSWWALAAAGVALWVGIGVSSLRSGDTVNTSARSTPTSPATGPATTSRGGAPATTSAVPAATTTSIDPDEVSDPSAAQAAPPPAAAEVTTSASASCRPGNPLANVYHPSRLHLVNRCTTVTGTVQAVDHESDGDLHVNVVLDAPYRGLTNARNVSGEHGALVTEIVPADEPGCVTGQPPHPPSGSYDYGICTGAEETAPAVGQHVTVTGPYVLDADHGWMEIHPVWSITASSAQPSTTPAPVTTAAAPAPPGSGVVTAGSFCSPAGANGVTSGGVPMTCSTQSCTGAPYGQPRWRKTTCG